MIVCWKNDHLYASLDVWMCRNVCEWLCRVLESVGMSIWFAGMAIRQCTTL